VVAAAVVVVVGWITLYLYALMSSIQVRLLFAPVISCVCKASQGLRLVFVIEEETGLLWGQGEVFRRGLYSAAVYTYCASACAV